MAETAAENGDPAHASKAPGETGLEQYISAAEVNTIKRPGRQYPRKHVFSNTGNNPSPRLRKNQINRNLVYRGRFDPPHRHHRALLTYAFLCTGPRTVAAAIEMVYYPDSKREPNPKQEVYPGRCKELKKHLAKLARPAHNDGYEIEYVYLVGLENFHYFISDTYHGLKIKQFTITSDITRPAEFGLSENEDDRLRNWTRWRKVLPGASVKPESEMLCWHGLSSCWPCTKFKQTYPEFAEARSIEDLDCFDGDGRSLLTQANTHSGVIWSCFHKYAGGRLMFLPFGRTYPIAPDANAVSATFILQILADAIKGSRFQNKQELHQAFRARTPNPGLLMSTMRLYDGWPFAVPVDPPECFPNGDLWNDAEWVAYLVVGLGLLWYLSNFWRGLSVLEIAVEEDGESHFPGLK